MINNHPVMRHLISLLVFTGMFVMVPVKYSNACSMYKITYGGKTMVGNNEDSWRLTSQLVFDPAVRGKYGVAFLTYTDKQHPDGAVNEAGLAFDAFSVPHKSGLLPGPDSVRKFNYTDLHTVMQECANVDEVYAFLSGFDRIYMNGSPLFHGGMLLFIDKSGKYLSVEADTMIFGMKDRYVLANFSVGDTPDLSTIRIERYCKGVAFLQNKIDTSLDFCTRLSDTMHVCRKRVGDGTLYTSIYDLEEGKIHLYFYHDYTHLVTFDLRDELRKGSHAYTMASLFPPNPDYQKLKEFQTPQNSRTLLFLLAGFGLLYAFSALYFFLQLFRKRPEQSRYHGKNRRIQVAMIFLSLALMYYVFSLLMNQAVFYFPAPYRAQPFSPLTFASYLPYVLLVLILPLLRMIARKFRDPHPAKFSNWVYTFNAMSYMVLIGLFAYWGFYTLL